MLSNINNPRSCRNEKLMEELAKNSLLDDMTTALAQMTEMFPDISVAEEFNKFEGIKQ